MSSSYPDPFEGLVFIAPEGKPEIGDYSIDIIAVPGLGADPKTSFISEDDGGFDWLKDEREGILSEFKTARVLKYGYESRWMGTEAINQSLGNVAEHFLVCLANARKDHPERPLIFVAHSLGGLVVARALTIADRNPEKIERTRIVECFAGAIFFGTPFSGSEQAASGVLLAAVLQNAKRGVPSQIMQVLDPQGEYIGDLRREFSELVQREPRAGIACIQEQKETNFAEALGPRVSKIMRIVGLASAIVVTAASATLDGASPAAMNVDHRQLNRFKNGKDPRFLTVKEMFRNIEINASRIVKKRLRASKKSVVDDATFNSLEECLNVDVHGSRMRIETASGNSEWILKDPTFEQWLDKAQDESGKFLWVYGDEGLGKSKAALAAVQTLEGMLREKTTTRTTESDFMVAYFFCDSTSDTHSVENMLSSLMWQLIRKRRSLGQYVRAFAGANSAKHSTRNSIGLAKLWTGLQDMLRDDSAPTVYFVVNNLHYLAKDASTAEFWVRINDLVAETGETQDPIRKNVNWMFLSRKRANIEDVLDVDIVAQINLNDSSRDEERGLMLNIFTHDRVKALAGKQGYSLALQYLLTSILLDRAENKQLWVEVVCCLLEALPANYWVVRDTVEKLPQDVTTLMSTVWAESLDPKRENIHRTKEILRTMAIVFEYPTLDELKVLAELGEDLDAKEVLNQIRACGPLLRIYDDGSAGGDLGSYRVTFIHDTAKEALIDPNNDCRTLIGFSESTGKTDQTRIRLQHGIVALRCFSHTNSEMAGDDDDDYFSRFQYEEEEDLTEDSAPELKGLFQDITNDVNGEDGNEDDFDEPSLEYPVKHWLRHGYEATANFVDTLDLKNSFWAPKSSARQRWWNCYAKRDGEVAVGLKNLTAMHVAAFFGLTHLIDSLIREGHKNEIQIRDSWDNQPLHWAAARGHIEAMEKLIFLGADINDGRVDQVWTPLHMAASEGRIDAMNHLMKENADIDAIDKDIGTALTLALACNQDEAVVLLLASGASATLASEKGESPLAMAAYMGEDVLIETILERGGAHNLVSTNYGSALAAAASAGNESIVRRLLPYSNTNSYERALKEATENGFHVIVEMLLQSPERLNLDDDFQNAASMGRDLVLIELWKHNQSQNGEAISKDAIDSALYLAAEAEQETTVLFLLQYCGANSNAHGASFGTALTAAAYDGNLEILNHLLQFRADISDPSGYPLQVASSQGHLNTVQVLLSNHASVNSHSHDFTDGTTLQAACVARQTEIAKVLLEHGADPNLGGGPLTSPLIAATTNSLGELAKLLLERGAKVNVFGGPENSTPLIIAAGTLTSKYLKDMIDHGANVDAVDGEGDTALIMSAYYGDADCVQVLLDADANVNLCGKNYGTALHVAAQEGHDEICLLLLQNGANPTIHGGPYDTVVQAAAYSGKPKCLKVLLENNSWKDAINVNLEGGKCFTPLRAAVVNRDDKPTRFLLACKPNVNALPKGGAATTALHAAAYAGCSRNARLLLEADADPNIDHGAHGTVLQVAALKSGRDLCELLIQSKAKIDDWSGPYGSALVAAVVRDYHERDTDVLEYLLEQNFTLQAYRAALDKAFVLQRKDAFKLIWQSIKSKKLRLNTGRLLEIYWKRANNRYSNVMKQEDENKDFDGSLEHYDQDIESDEEEEDDDENDDNQTNIGSTDRQLNINSTANGQQYGSAPRTLQSEMSDRSRGVDGRQDSGEARAAQNSNNVQARNMGTGDGNGPRAGGNQDDSGGYGAGSGTRGLRTGDNSNGRQVGNNDNENEIYSAGTESRNMNANDNGRRTQAEDGYGGYGQGSQARSEGGGGFGGRNAGYGSPGDEGVEHDDGFGDIDRDTRGVGHRSQSGYENAQPPVEDDDTQEEAYGSRDIDQEGEEPEVEEEVPEAEEDVPEVEEDIPEDVEEEIPEEVEETNEELEDDQEIDAHEGESYWEKMKRLAREE
ncbi:hypothetical protein VTL71DRAFT_2641 [Oculimacula yallundae]|uniref:Nephrocystin 3-like N-terminal domain-containing protein n=1 Tax=Oculimacula yallundae TaxID=86028 RepID=A0ABR4C9F2_9HELO